MVSLKLTAKDKTENQPVDIDDQKYPYGSRINISETKHVDALNVDGCVVGDEVLIIAKAKVSERGEHEGDNGVRKNIEFQITDMEVQKPTNDSDRSKALYS